MVLLAVLATWHVLAPVILHASKQHVVLQCQKLPAPIKTPSSYGCAMKVESDVCQATAVHVAGGLYLSSGWLTSRVCQ